LRVAKEKIDLWEIENGLHAAGFDLICGVDEAGRGPLAGPVCAAAVILPQGLMIEGLNDSKKLSEKKREALFPLICEQALAYSIAFSSVEEIEEINILQAAMLAMKRAIGGLAVKPELALIDGNRCPETEMESRFVIGGDGKCASIAAASVLAKVTRDRLMRELAEKYPQYGFEKHKGYGTKAHVEALRLYGPCEIHRPSFLKKLAL
jgi:ribonuclease HII